MHVYTQICVGVGITALLCLFVLLFGSMWFEIIHKDADWHLGWVGLYGALTVFVAILCILGCGKKFGWGRQRVVLPIHINDDDE